MRFPGEVVSLLLGRLGHCHGKCTPRMPLLMQIGATSLAALELLLIYASVSKKKTWCRLGACWTGLVMLHGTKSTRQLPQRHVVCSREEAPVAGACPANAVLSPGIAAPRRLSCKPQPSTR